MSLFEEYLKDKELKAKAEQKGERFIAKGACYQCGANPFYPDDCLDFGDPDCPCFGVNKQWVRDNYGI